LIFVWLFFPRFFGGGQGAGGDFFLWDGRGRILGGGGPGPGGQGGPAGGGGEKFFRRGGNVGTWGFFSTFFSGFLKKGGKGGGRLGPLILSFPGN